MKTKSTQTDLGKVDWDETGKEPSNLVEQHVIIEKKKLKKIFNHSKTLENFNGYKKQKTFCIKLLSETKAKYFQNLKVQRRIRELALESNYTTLLTIHWIQIKWY